MLGVIGRKVGMTRIFNENGLVIPVTVIEIEPNVVVGHKNPQRDGYSALILGAVKTKKSRLSKPQQGQFAENIEPRRKLVELRDCPETYLVGDSVGVEIFKDVAFVDVAGTSKGKGFAGAMKRHGFSGGPAAHGSKFHRGLGGTGSATKPGKTFKGTRMAGRMGHENVTVQNLKVVRVDEERGAVLVCGAIPGNRDDFVFIRKARKK